MNKKKHFKWTDEEVEAEKHRLRGEILKKEKELHGVKRQLELLEDALCVFNI